MPYFVKVECGSMSMASIPGTTKKAKDGDCAKRRFSPVSSDSLFYLLLIVNYQTGSFFKE
jgi:hypothetical protein